LVKGSLGDSTVIAPTDVDYLSIDGTSDADFFSFTLTQGLDVTISLTPKGASYSVAPLLAPETVFHSRSLSDLSLALYDNSGVQLGVTADVNGAGLGESIFHRLAPGTYVARVQGAHDHVQLYQLAINGNTAGFAADFNEDGHVDSSDLGRWNSGFGELNVAFANGDADFDADADGADFLTWQRQFGLGILAMPAGHTVPEPSGVLLGIGGLLCVRRRVWRT